MTSFRAGAGSANSRQMVRLVLPAAVGLCLLAAGALVAAKTTGSAPRSHPGPRPAAVTARRPTGRPSPATGPQPLGRDGPIPFQRDACLGFAPTGRPAGATVFLDPGHGGTDPGAMAIAGGRVMTEKQVSLAIARRALPLLRGAGYRVVMSRVGDTTVARIPRSDVHDRVLTPAGAQREIEARDLCADAARATVLVALHMDAFSDPSVHGSEAFYCPSRPFATRSRRLAEAIQRAVVAGMSTAGMAAVNRGVLPDADGGGRPLTPQTAGYHHLVELGPADPPWLPYPSRMPGVLLEPAFLSNPSDAAFVASARGQRVLARAIVTGVSAYLRTHVSP